MTTPLPNHTTAHGPTDFEDGAGLTPQQWWEVVAPPQHLADRCAQLLPTPGEVLDGDQLEELARAVVADPELWEPLVVVDAERRRYRLLYEDDRIDVWVLSWMPDQATGFHDHDRAGVGLACAAGTVVERQMLLPSGTVERELRPGDARQGPVGYIHAVSHRSGEPAVTIHAYSPPLEQVGQYRVDEDGVLRREPMHGRQELLDHTIAALDPSLG